MYMAPGNNRVSSVMIKPLRDCLPMDFKSLLTYLLPLDC